MFKINQRSIIYTFRANNTPYNPRGKSCKLCKLPIVDINKAFYSEKWGMFDLDSPERHWILKWNFEVLLKEMTDTKQTMCLLVVKREYQQYQKNGLYY